MIPFSGLIIILINKVKSILVTVKSLLPGPALCSEQVRGRPRAGRWLPVPKEPGLEEVGFPQEHVQNRGHGGCLFEPHPSMQRPTRLFLFTVAANKRALECSFCSLSPSVGLAGPCPPRSWVTGSVWSVVESVQNLALSSDFHVGI